MKTSKKKKKKKKEKEQCWEPSYRQGDLKKSRGRRKRKEEKTIFVSGEVYQVYQEKTIFV